MRIAEAVARLPQIDTLPLIGRVTGVTGLVIEGRGPKVRIGEICWVSPSGPVPEFPAVDTAGLWAEVVGFRTGQVLLMPLGTAQGLAPGWEIRALGRPFTISVDPALRGRVLDGLGRPLDSMPALAGIDFRPVHATAPQPLERRRIDSPLPVGVRVIDGLLTVGRGQRIGIFAGSGVGKSTLLGMMARGTAAAVNVIALIGERGREVREFIENDLGTEGLKRSVVVVATSDQPALVRIKGALLATAIAEYFRDQGQDVLLMVDSITRLAWAQREVGLAAGEPPASRGYTPSVFALLPELLERAGTGAAGSITGFYTVLVEGDDLNEPIADTVRGVLDGHIVLSRRLAGLNQYPAVDVLASVSRLMSQVTSAAHRQAAADFRTHLATYREAEDLVNIGAYQPGSSPGIDAALAKLDAMLAYQRQETGDLTSLAAAEEQLRAIFPPAGKG